MHQHRRWRPAGAASWLAVLLLPACAPDATVPAGESEATAPPTHFTIRGRWHDVADIRYRAEQRGAPLPAEQFVAAVDRACQTWSRTGIVKLTRADEGERVDVTFAWRRGHHGAYEPFGTNATVAQAGPVGPGSFVHFDASREWKAAHDAPGDGYVVYGTALHELGHVLGLGHSAAEDAVMRTGVVRDIPLSRSDVFALQTLYGGGEDRPGDLLVVAAGAQVATSLRGVAPPDISGYAVFDADGDDRDDVLVWRTDRAGHGVLMIYHFADGAKVARTTGPFYGMVAPGAQTLALRTAAGDRLLLAVWDNGRRLARRFDSHALLQPHDAQIADEVVHAAQATGNARQGDLDGDGRIEDVRRVR